MALYTFIMNFRGGTYIAQIVEEGVESAALKWILELDCDGIYGFGEVSKGLLQQEIEEAITCNSIVPINTTKNVWFIYTILRGFPAEIHIIKTCEEQEELIQDQVKQLI